MIMKKYLMTGIAAFAICFGFTSCSHDLDGMTQEDLEQMEAKKAIKTYQAAFKAYVGGEIAPNQDWGFGATSFSSRTRVNYANSNHWGATAESDPNDPERGWIVPDTLTDGQRLRVTRYFQTHPYLTYEDPHWTNFFVQQVYTGGTNVKTGTNPITGESYSPEFYRSGEKLSTEAADITSSNLNYLFAYGETEHIANFNAATASYKPVLETGEDINNGKKHNDRINLMVNSSTYDFSYQNSYSSIRHGQPYVALVSAQVIDDWADSLYNATNELIGENVYYGKSYSGKDNSYWNRSFLGCDLELLIGDDIYIKGYADYYTSPWDGHWVDDYRYFQPETYGNTYKYLIKNTNKFGGDLRKYPNNPPTGDELNWLLTNGYLPVADTADKEWVKPLPVADHYYSDWIVTLSEAKRQDTPPTPPTPPSDGDLRVMAEDLTLGSSDEDFDFNDIVFDVYYGNAGSAKVKIKAAGGTLSLRITKGDLNPATDDDWYEVHDLFAAANPGVNCTGMMINTRGTEADQPQGVRSKSLDNLTEPDFITLNFNVNSPAEAKNIKIQVKKGNSWADIEADQGQPAAKFAVPVTVDWCKERVSIKHEYEKFCEWATRTPNLQWWVSNEN